MDEMGLYLTAEPWFASMGSEGYWCGGMEEMLAGASLRVEGMGVVIASPYGRYED